MRFTASPIEALERRLLLHSDGLWGEGEGEGGVGPGAVAPAVTAAAGPNLRVTSAFVVSGRNVVTGPPMVGQMVFVRAEWASEGVAVGTQYVVRFAVDGVPADSGVVTNSVGDGNWWWYRGGWYASPGAHTVTVTIDGATAVAETDESDNTTSFSFTPAPAAPPFRLIQPIGLAPNRDWVVTNYHDVDPRPGVAADYRGGPYVNDTHNAIDAGPGSFAAQDAGLSVNAAAAGLVTEVRDGNFDRETALNGRPANYVRIDHGGGWETTYVQLAQNTITVRVGQSVAAGQLLGLMGSSGGSTGTHLHFALLKDGGVVETGYAPEAYWVSPLPYAGDVPPLVLRSGTSNYNVWEEHQEGLSGVDVFPASANWTAFYWAQVTNLGPSDVLNFRWYRPDGVLDRIGVYSPTAFFRSNRYAWSLPPAAWAAFPGQWQVAFTVNGAELDRRRFTVTTGPGLPEIKVTQNEAVVLDGRTTPFDLGSVPAGGAPPQMSFDVINHGAAPLTLGELDLPPGFSPVGSFPSEVLPNAASTFTVRLDTAVPGAKFGAVRFTTNDLDEALFSFNLAGTVTGTAPAGAPVLALPGPAVPYRKGAPAAVIDAGATVIDADSPAFGGGSLTVEFDGEKHEGDRLGVRLQGSGPGQVSTAGSNVLFGGTVVGTWSGGAGGAPLVVSFNAASTPAAVEAIARNVTFANTLPAPASRRRYIRFSVMDGSGQASNKPMKVVAFDNLPRPEVGGLFIGGARWSPAFGGFLQSAGLGSASHGFAVPLAESTDVLPWTNLDRLSVRFSEAVTGLGVSSLRVHGAAVASYTPGGFAYDPSTFTATWALSTPMKSDRLQLSLSGVADAAGNPLAGFTLPINVLAGDADRNGRVDMIDLAQIKRRLGRSSVNPGGGAAAYSPQLDLDGNGRIDMYDYMAARIRLLSRLPTAAPPTSLFATVRVASRRGDDGLAAAVLA